MQPLPLFPAHPPPPVADPWAEVLAPALRGRRPPLDRLDPARGDHAAVAARCLLLRRHTAAARRALASALEREHPDAAALAWLLEGRVVPVGTAGSAVERADAWVDRALLELGRGQVRRAEEAARQALECVPHHAEARLLLALESGPTPALLAGRARGGLSIERLRRRLLGGAWGGADPSPWVAAGLLTRVLPRAPACLAAEAACDHLLGVVRLGLPAAEAAQRCWTAARALGPEGVVPVARWLAGLQTVDPGAVAPVQRAASGVLRRVGLVPPGAAVRPPAQLVLAR